MDRALLYDPRLGVLRRDGRMLVETVIEDSRWEKTRLPDLAEAAAVETLTHLELDPARHEIALLACDDTRIAVLNQTFRGKGVPTNVLSWPADELFPDRPGGEPDRPEAGELGDIALAWETCTREAADADKALDAHLRHLVVHAVLHLLGYDHETDADAARMEEIEIAVLGKLGDPSPY